LASSWRKKLNSLGRIRDLGVADGPNQGEADAYGQTTDTPGPSAELSIDGDLMAATRQSGSALRGRSF
jgi:hypothetical protein